MFDFLLLQPFNLNSDPTIYQIMTTLVDHSEVQWKKDCNILWEKNKANGWKVILGIPIIDNQMLRLETRFQFDLSYN